MRLNRITLSDVRVNRGPWMIERASRFPRSKRSSQSKEEASERVSKPWGVGCRGSWRQKASMVMKWKSIWRLKWHWCREEQQKLLLISLRVAIFISQLGKSLNQFDDLFCFFIVLDHKCYVILKQCGHLVHSSRHLFLQILWAEILTCRTLTCNLASVKLEAKGDAVLPRLRPDPNKAGQNWLRDTVQNHLCWVCVRMENLKKDKQ